MTNLSKICYFNINLIYLLITKMHKGTIKNIRTRLLDAINLIEEFEGVGVDSSKITLIKLKSIISTIEADSKVSKEVLDDFYSIFNK